MTVISIYGDTAMDFILAEQEAARCRNDFDGLPVRTPAFIEGTTQLAGIAGTTLVQPVVQETARAFSWVLGSLSSCWSPGAAGPHGWQFATPKARRLSEIWRSLADPTTQDMTAT